MAIGYAVIVTLAKCSKLVDIAALHRKIYKLERELSEERYARGYHDDEYDQ